MSATRGTLDSLLKDFYLGPVVEQLNNEMLVLNMYEKMSVDWSGRQTIIPIHISRTANTAVQFLAESTAAVGVALPTPGNQGYSNLTVVARYLYGTFRISGPAVASAKNGGKGAFIGWMEAEMDRLVTDVKNTADYAMLNGGGVIGFITDAVNNATHAFTGDYSKIIAAKDVTLANCFGPGLDSTGALINTTYLNDIGGAVQLHAAAPKNEPAGTIQFVAAQDTTAAGFGGTGRVAPVVVRAHTDLTAFQGEPVGIMSNLFGNGGVAGTPDHFGIQVNGAARSGSLDVFARVTAATAGTAATADLTVERIQQVLDEVATLSGEEPDVILCHPSLRANYVAVLTASLFATTRGSATKGDAGFLDLSFGNIPIKFARHCPRGMMIFMNKKTWKLLQLQSGGFADLDGTTILRQSGHDAWEGFYRWYYNTVCTRPNANGLLVGIDVWS
jgi:hypothetical protein